jgi:hypothetical protein
MRPIWAGRRDAAAFHLGPPDWDSLIERFGVRSRLFAGGKGIRTLGPTETDRQTPAVVDRHPAIHRIKSPFSDGTDGSNPTNRSHGIRSPHHVDQGKPQQADSPKENVSLGPEA